MRRVLEARQAKPGQAFFSRRMMLSLCLNQIDEICRVSVKRRAQALRLISLAGSRSGLVGLLTVTQPLPSDTPGGRVGLCRGQRPSFRGRCAGG